MGQIIPLLLFLLSANLDTVLLAMSWGLRQRRFTTLAVLIIAAITTVATWLALVLGGYTAELMAAQTAKEAGGVLLILIGIWMVIDGLREKEVCQTAIPATLAECSAVALALAVNNMGMGVGAGLAGLDPRLAALCNFLITIGSMILGCGLGRRTAGTWISRYAPMLSGGLSIVLGAVEPWL